MQSTAKTYEKSLANSLDQLWLLLYTTSIVCCGSAVRPVNVGVCELCESPRTVTIAWHNNIRVSTPAICQIWEQISLSAFLHFTSICVFIWLVFVIFFFSWRCRNLSHIPTTLPTHNCWLCMRVIRFVQPSVDTVDTRGTHNAHNRVATNDWYILLFLARIKCYDFRMIPMFKWCSHEENYLHSFTTSVLCIFGLLPLRLCTSRRWLRSTSLFQPPLTENPFAQVSFWRANDSSCLIIIIIVCECCVDCSPLFEYGSSIPKIAARAQHRRIFSVVGGNCALCRLLCCDRKKVPLIC